MLAAAKTEPVGLFYVCNPNNPTGTVTPRAEIAALVAAKPEGSLVLLDEAYIHFSDEPPGADLVRENADVVVLRTFSKIYGMAGLRCGYAVARPWVKKSARMASSGWMCRFLRSISSTAPLSRHQATGRMTSQSASGAGARTSAAERSIAEPAGAAMGYQYPVGGALSATGSATRISLALSVPRSWKAR